VLLNFLTGQVIYLPLNKICIRKKKDGTFFHRKEESSNFNNVKLTKNKSNPTVKLAEFGLKACSKTDLNPSYIYDILRIFRIA